MEACSWGGFVTSPAARLRPHLALLLRQLRQFGRVRREYLDDVAALLEAAVDAHAGRSEAMTELNRARAAEVRATVRSVAQRVLTEPVRRVYPSRDWTGLVRDALQLRHKCGEIDVMPSRPTIRSVVRCWIGNASDGISSQSAYSSSAASS